ncbi:response regulator receiver domain-containing protein [Rhodospirillum rubrum F11]|uniref:Response regulator receiver domain protein (CheY) n=2 Tax=Rhodospirillum rubrum TaxID=1085 RepID=Q2RRW9_RHORT|nr:response regulator [Rhodospirillum rubrum]ABC23126.1 Response regulator receiver domain protein (CheY) [Rhodospirillum rubrum ATCC 11170]AEO48856.1 response regulator receiver domain-containing protein [Rhodospirillum rubrum F11]MBK5954740.1 response regulator [Rhodospirillum rubrum]QXG79110.1 response regulator [Rhodospirillum rubrum]HAQ00780.1 response regulator [Rhodospirillum rubrum]
MSPLSAPCVTPRVLVIDDSITMRLFYRSVLEAAGFEVEEAINGVEGYEKVLSNDFDLLIVDINMPKMDGYSMLRAIRRDSAVLGVPALTISMESGDADALKAFEAGANYYLVKPVAPAMLTEVAQLLAGVGR